jgi:hypothetical protein
MHKDNMMGNDSSEPIYGFRLNLVQTESSCRDLSPVAMKIRVFLDVLPWSLVHRYHRFGRTVSVASSISNFSEHVSRDNASDFIGEILISNLC